MFSLINLPRSVDKNCCKKTVSKHAHVPLTEAQLKGIFMRFDTNKDGQLSKEELKNAFKSLGAQFPGWRAFGAIKNADRNGDGVISENELDGLVKYANKCGYTIA